MCSATQCCFHPAEISHLTMTQNRNQAIFLFVLCTYSYARDLSLLRNKAASALATERAQPVVFAQNFGQANRRTDVVQTLRSTRNVKAKDSSGLQRMNRMVQNKKIVSDAMQEGKLGNRDRGSSAHRRINAISYENRRIMKRMGQNRPRNLNLEQQSDARKTIVARQNPHRSQLNLRASQNRPRSDTNVTLAEFGARRSFDFIIAGFPKCGTTTLLKAFSAHGETDMVSSAMCAVASPAQSDRAIRTKLDETLNELSSDPNIKRALKCPTAMYNYRSLVHMEKHSPGAKFIVGLRHPVKMLQSFYNYRVTEIYERHLHEYIPPLDEVLGAKEAWKGVSIESTQFEVFLTQMGKCSVTAEQMKLLTSPYYDLAVKPTNFTVFLYTVNQLDDRNLTRSNDFRKYFKTS